MIRGIFSEIATELVDEFREELPRPLKLALLALAFAVTVGLAVSPLPGAKMIRGDIASVSTDSPSTDIRDTANAARANKDRAESRATRVGS